MYSKYNKTHGFAFKNCDKHHDISRFLTFASASSSLSLFLLFQIDRDTFFLSLAYAFLSSLFDLIFIFADLWHTYSTQFVLLCFFHLQIVQGFYPLKRSFAEEICCWIIIGIGSWRWQTVSHFLLFKSDFGENYACAIIVATLWFWIIMNWH